MEKNFINLAVLLLLVAAPVFAAGPKESEDAAREQDKTAQLAGLAEKLADKILCSGLVEVEYSAGKDFSRTKTHDANLATVALGLDATITELVAAHLLALYEEGEGDHFVIGEGTITLGNMESAPFHLTAGKMYLPFGSFASTMISDPLPLELAETSNTAMLTGFAGGGWRGSLYLFHGEVDEPGENDTIGSSGAALDYNTEQAGWLIGLGAGWLNNLGGSDTIRDHIATTSVTVKDFTGGLSLHGSLRHGGWSALAEYVAALDSFLPGEMAFAGRGAQPRAWQLECAYTTEVAERAVTLALGYQRTDEAMALGLPEYRYLGSVGVGIFENTTLLLEHRQDHDYALAVGGTDESAHQTMAQLAVEF